MHTPMKINKTLDLGTLLHMPGHFSYLREDSLLATTTTIGSSTGNLLHKHSTEKILTSLSTKRCYFSLSERNITSLYILTVIQIIS